MMRQLLLRPPLFQAVSSILQRRDRRRPTLDAGRPWTPYLERVDDYNRAVGAGKVTRTRRAERLYALVKDRLRDADVLIVGPRDVHELYLAWCYGAAWSRITGIDLTSRNPKILVRDMAHSGFADQSFDVIVASATLSYLASVRDGLHEMYRVLRPGGVFAFTHTHDVQSAWHGNRAWPGSVALWAADVGFSVVSMVTEGKVSAQAHRVLVMTCVLRKETRCSP